MIVVKILLWTGCALLAIPMLYIIGSIVEDMIWTWKRASWGSRMDGLFLAGVFCLLLALGSWCIVRGTQEWRDADSSTDTIEQNSTPGGKLQPIGVAADEALHMEGRGLQEQGAESPGD